MNGSCHTHINGRCRSYELVIRQSWLMSHVTHMNGSCHTYEWVMLNIRKCHVTPIMQQASRSVAAVDSHEWGMSDIRMRHVTHMNEACANVYVLAHIRVFAHIRMRHVTHMNEACHTHEWGTSHNEWEYHTHKWGKSHTWLSHITCSPIIDG